MEREVAIGVILGAILLAVLLKRRGQTAAMVLLHVTPVALLPVSIGVLIGARQYMRGLGKLAQEEKGGLPAVAGVCLGSVRAYFVGVEVFVLILVLAAALGVVPKRFFVGTRAESSAAGQSSKLSIALGIALITLAFCVGALVFEARRLVVLTLLMVDPSKQLEAERALAGNTLTGVSEYLASHTAGVILGAGALILLSVALTMAGFVVLRRQRLSRGVSITVWGIAAILVLSGMLGLVELRSVLSGSRDASRSSILSRGIVDGTEESDRRLFRLGRDRICDGALGACGH